MISTKTDIEKLKSASKDDLIKLIHGRVGELEKQFAQKVNNRRDVCFSGLMPWGGIDLWGQWFDDKNTTIAIDALNELKFHFDDKERIYLMLLNNLTAEPTFEKSLENAIQKAVTKTVFDYFHFPDGQMEDADTLDKKRIELMEEQTGKISDFYQKGIAKCVERASLAHQLFQFLGIKSLVVYGYIKNNGKDELHTYNLIVSKDGTGFIYDCSLPRAVYQNDTISGDPMIHRFSNNEIQEILNKENLPFPTKTTRYTFWRTEKTVDCNPYNAKKADIRYKDFIEYGKKNEVAERTVL